MYINMFVNRFKYVCKILYIYIYIYIYKGKFVTLVKNELKALFSLVTTPRWREGRYSFLWNAPLYP